MSSENEQMRFLIKNVKRLQCSDFKTYILINALVFNRTNCKQKLSQGKRVLIERRENIAGGAFLLLLPELPRDWMQFHPVILCIINIKIPTPGTLAKKFSFSIFILLVL